MLRYTCASTKSGKPRQNWEGSPYGKWPLEDPFTRRGVSEPRERAIRYQFDEKRLFKDQSEYLTIWMVRLGGASENALEDCHSLWASGFDLVK